jgi:ferritin
MKLSNTIEKALNDQLNLELSSAYAYLGMAGYFEGTPFKGFASWMKIQSGEEMEHAKKFFEYVADRNGTISLQRIEAPKCDFKSTLEAFQASLGHEQRVSASISSIYDLANAEKDYATAAFLKWFLDEQVEEEKNVSDMVDMLVLIGDNKNGLFHLDHRAAKRGKQD